MTREQAIKFLKLDKAQRKECLISQAIDVAIEALKQEPIRSHEHWKFVERGKIIDVVCPVCGKVIFKEFAYNYSLEDAKAWFYSDDVEKPNFCCECGAKIAKSANND